MIYEYTKDESKWKEFLEARDMGQRCEIDEEMYYYWLEVLPPKVGQQCVADDGQLLPPIGAKGVFWFADGSEPLTAFWRDGSRFFCQRSAIDNGASSWRYALQVLASFAFPFLGESHPAIQVCRELGWRGVGLQDAQNVLVNLQRIRLSREGDKRGN